MHFFMNAVRVIAVCVSAMRDNYVCVCFYLCCVSSVRLSAMCVSAVRVCV